MDLVPFWLPQSTSTQTKLSNTSDTFSRSVDVDILKPDTGYLSVIERPSAFSSQPGSAKSSSTPASSSRQTLSPPSSEGMGSPVIGYTEPLSEGEEDDDQELRPARDEQQRTGLDVADVNAAIAYREQMLKERRAEEEDQRKRKKRQGKEKSCEPVQKADYAYEDGDGASHPSTGDVHRPSFLHKKSSGISKQVLSIDPLAPSSAFDETLKTKLEGEQLRRHKKGGSASSSRVSTSRTRYGPRNDQVEDRDVAREERPEDEVEEEIALGGPQQERDDRILDRSWRAPEGKKISIPVRIEPKVYFAAERTFLVSCPFFILYTLDTCVSNKTNLFCHSMMY